MATLDEIYTKALADEDERKAFAKAAPDAQDLAAYLQERGCDATPEEARAFLDGKLSRTGELAGEELASVAGGGCDDNPKCPQCGSANTTMTHYATYANEYKCNDCGHTWSVFYGMF